MTLNPVTAERRVVGIRATSKAPYKYNNGITKGWKIDMIYTDDHGDDYIVPLNFRLKRDAVAEQASFSEVKTPRWEMTIGLDSSGVVQYWIEEFGNPYKGVTR